MSKEIADKIIALWQKAIIPNVSYVPVLTMIKHLLISVQICVEEIKLLVLQKNELFDIAACKCKKGKKVANREREFLADQRSTRKIFIGGINKWSLKK